MKGRIVAIENAARGFRAALIVDGKLEDLLIDPQQGQKPLPSSGDIVVVRMTRVLQNGRGAFAEMAGGGEGFFRDTRGLRTGERILSQVNGIAEPGKAVPLSRRVLFKGPRIILTPDAPGINVSRKIGNETERTRLVKAVEAAIDECSPQHGIAGKRDGIGAIIRTSARGEEETVLAHEVLWLLARIRNKDALVRAHADLYDGSEGTALETALREWLFPVPEALITTASTAQYLRKSCPEASAQAFWGDERFFALIREEKAPFEAMGVEENLADLQEIEVSIHFGSMTIEPTRALVAVDVNTGADFSPAAGLKANLAAARELPRQLRLRGLGGQIVVDFAPMPRKDRRTLEETLRKAFRADPVETNLVGWTTLGNFELQRKRERRPLHEVL